MNPNRTVYGRLTINDEQISLGRERFEEVIRRLMAKYGAQKYQGEKLRLIVEISDDPLGVESIMSRELQLQNEMQSLMTPLDEEQYPGVTVGEVLEAFESKEYQAWRHVCDPQKRIGVPESHIAELREAYKSRYPLIFPYDPIWRT